MSRFARTIKVLAEYDAGKAERARQLSAVLTESDWERYAKMEAKAVTRVQSAFFADTCDVNSWDRVKLVHPDDPWLRDLVKGASCSTTDPSSSSASCLVPH